jgi:hypothetical protein
MGRKILFITTDQQRYDSLGCNGNRICRTPAIDALAKDGINYARAYNQNTVCMPARSTMLTGQYVRTHGVFANGVPLPESAPSVAQYLKDKAGYKTALIGKAHFEPGFDMAGKWRENRRQMEGDFGPWRGFDYAIHAMHITSFRGNPAGHYGRWMQKNHPECFDASAPLLNASPGGDTGAPETMNNPVPRAFYHTDWLADLAVEWLNKLDATKTGSCGSAFPIRIIPGIRRLPKTSAATGAICRCRKAIRERRKKSAKCWRRSPRTGSPITTAPSPISKAAR